MMRRVWAALLVEWTKAARRRITVAGPLAVLLAVLASAMVMPVVRDDVSDYGFVSFATGLALNPLGLFFVLAFSAGLIAPEVQDGSVRAMLVRPLYRREYLFAKLLLGMGYAAVLILTAGVASWAMLYILGDALGVTYGGELLYSPGAMLRTYWLGAALALLPQWAAVAYGLLVSVCSRSGVAAITIAFGAWLMVDVAKYQANVPQIWVATYLDVPWEPFIDRVNGIESNWLQRVLLLVQVSSIAWCVATAGAVFVLNRRNICR